MALPPIEEESHSHELFPTDDISILVIDHDINNLNAIAKLCSNFNHKVKTCTKVSEALNLLMEKRVHFDVVLIEAKMPDMDSHVFLQHVTQQLNIPVIMMCVENTTSVARNAVENGAWDYWAKPLSEREIKFIWKYVAKKLFDENKKEEMNEIFGVKGKKELEKDNSKLPLINGAIREGENDDNVTKESSWKKTRVKWSSKLHQKFVSVVNELNDDAVVPSKILEKMNVAGLTRENVASHLQKYRLYLKSQAEKEQQNQIQNAIMNSSLFPNISHAAVQQNSMPYQWNSYQQFPNNLMATNFPHQSSNLTWQQQFPPAEYNNIAAIANINNSTLPLQQGNHVYQTNNAINNNYQNGVASVNQHNFSGFGGINSITDSSFSNTLNAHYPQNTQGGSFFLGCNSNQIPMTQQPLPMSSSTLPIDGSGSSSGFTPFSGADIGDIDAIMTMAEEAELNAMYGSTQNYPFY